jgi:hypothetical protein
MTVRVKGTFVVLAANTQKWRLTAAASSTLIVTSGLPLSKNQKKPASSDSSSVLASNIRVAASALLRTAPARLIRDAKEE